MSCGRPPPDVDGMITLKVDNLTYRTSPDSLRPVFEKYGRVGDVYIPREPHTKAPRGFAFVRFHYRSDAQDAEAAMDGAVLDGRELRVQMARYGRRDLPRSSQEEPSGRSWGGRYGRRSRSPRGRHRSQSRGPSYSRSRSRSHYGGSPYRRSHSKSGSRSRSPSTSKSSSPRRSKSSSVSRSCSRSRSRSTSGSPPPTSKRESKSRSRSKSPPKSPEGEKGQVPS
ncbi:serine/arginine-rich splicing factor 8-like isoform X2 [Gorilla gorilla gorilla]|uniref:serine/arginine-rich splicing factor 8-like isoform X2 n=1 Tax=Gorilla gorilla gorilla TaxID=9595 RepID=UPI0024463204|nr:serine/arginine-rich splicing factor 8-like isoform X2 [Gorilla gorilla gorilla]